MQLQHPVPAEHLASIGDVTVSFALLEMQLQALAQSLLGSDQRIGQIVTAELSFKALRALTVSLYLQRNGQDAYMESLRTLIRRAADAEEQRNQIVHSLWAAGLDAGTLTRIKTTAKERHGIRFQFESVSAEQLAAFAQELKILAGDFQTFYVRLLGNARSINHQSEP